MKRLELTGQKFERWTIIKENISQEKYKKYTLWDCICDCGTQRTLRGDVLKHGKSKSCGCYHKDKCQITNQIHRLPAGEASKNILFSRYKKSAQVRNIVWNLTKEEFLSLTLKNCYYCNNQPNQICIGNLLSSKWTEQSKYIYNGIDRIDNTKEYTLTNCVSCCKMCNRIKMDSNINDLFNHLQKMIEFYGKKKNEL